MFRTTSTSSRASQTRWDATLSPGHTPVVDPRPPRLRTITKTGKRRPPAALAQLCILPRAGVGGGGSCRAPSAVLRRLPQAAAWQAPAGGLNKPYRPIDRVRPLAALALEPRREPSPLSYWLRTMSRLALTPERAGHAWRAGESRWVSISTGERGDAAKAGERCPSPQPCINPRNDPGSSQVLRTTRQGLAGRPARPSRRPAQPAGGTSDAFALDIASHTTSRKLCALARARTYILSHQRHDTQPKPYPPSFRAFGILLQFPSLFSASLSRVSTLDICI